MTVEDKLKKLEADILKKEKQEKQDTGFNTLNTLAQKELVRLLYCRLRGENA